MPADVVMLPGADRPEDAMKFIAEACASEKKIRGIVVAIIDESDDGCDARIFDNANRMELAYLGAIITQHAVT